MTFLSFLRMFANFSVNYYGDSLLEKSCHNQPIQKCPEYRITT